MRRWLTMSLPAPHARRVAQQFLSSLALMLAAAQVGPEPAAPVARRDHDGCSIERRPRSPTGEAVLLGRTIRGQFRLELSRADWTFAPDKVLLVRLHDLRVPDSVTTPDVELVATAISFRDSAGWSGLRFEGSAVDSMLRDGARVALYPREGVVPPATIEADYAELRGAVGACLRAAIGDDNGSGKPATVPPTLRRPITDYVTDADYPSAAVRAGDEGQVGVRIAVSAYGRATDCTIVRSSGSALLDSSTCSILRRRARFLSALDAEGNATRGDYETNVGWRIIEEE